MHIAIIIQIICNLYDNSKITYNTIDTFTRLNDDEETLETKIMKKYPTFENIPHCDDCVVYDIYTGHKYLITNIYI